MKFKLFPIAGDASYRSFYRLTSSKGSRIIVFSQREKYQNLIAYSAVNNFLKKNRIFTPKLYNHNYKNGIIIIEDLGNNSFYKVLLKQKNKFFTYKKLVNLLIKIQKIEPKSKITNVFGKAHFLKKYTTKFLHKESDLFFDWYLPLFLKKNKVKSIKKRTKKILSKLYNSLYFSNSYFVHRDFHAQNLMKLGNKIGVIDTQDAIIGNPTYDLVSLIDDVRIKTSSKLKEKVFKYYLKKTIFVHRKNSNKFLEDFNILSVQRSLKIIGIFSRLFKRDKKNNYLKFIPYTWKILETRMGSEIFSDLKEILNKNVNKKIRTKVAHK
jgi:N-acetylmuramate 1-kinase